MIQTLQRAVQSIYALNQLSVVSRALPIPRWILGGKNATPLVASCRGMKQYEKDYRRQIYARKRKEKILFPERSEPVPRSTYLDWNYKSEIYAFGKRLSEEFDDRLLREALTEQSYIHKEKLKQEELGIDTAELDLKNNEQLSELGILITKNTLLEFVRREIPGFPTEGHQALVQHLTSVETMSKVGLNLGLKELILCEEYPPTEETCSRTMFAVIGALEKSSGLERAQKFVIDFVASLLCGKDINEIWSIDRPWKLMVEIATLKGIYPVEPRLIFEAGRNTIHAAFVVGVYDKNKMFLGKGTGETLDIAQEMAARDVLKGFFNTRQPQEPYDFQAENIPYKLIPHVRNINK